MLRFGCGLWIGCGRFVDTMLRFLGFTHTALVGLVSVGYSTGLYTQFNPCVLGSTIHKFRVYFPSVIFGFSSFSTSLIITTPWYKNNFFISSLCGKVAI